MGESNLSGLELGVREVIHLMAMPVLMEANNTSKKVIRNRKLDEMSQITEGLKSQRFPITAMQFIVKLRHSGKYDLMAGYSGLI